MIYQQVSAPRVEVGLSWEDIRYHVLLKNSKEHTKGYVELLHGVSGYANPGQVLAIMGGSGAGKTTLLNILSDRISQGSHTKVTGKITANGQDIHSFGYSTYVGYVMQDDILLDTMTPRECLQFSADMRIQGSVQEKKVKVDKLLEDLRLTKVADNRVGSVLQKGISGGERRRTSIGVELITDPSAVFLDGIVHIEPTSGLDSFTAYTVMSVLSNLAKTGVAIVCTIHQPSSDIFSLFDRLILMTEGNVVYQGPAVASMSYFDSINYKCPRLTNPADYYMKILHVTDRTHMTAEEQTRTDYLVKSFQENKVAMDQKLTHTLPQLTQNTSHMQASYFLQLRKLSIRSFFNAFRNPVMIRTRIGQLIVNVIMMLLLYNDIGNGFVGIQNRAGLLNLLVILVYMMAYQSAILSFPLERALFLKEQSQKLYKVSAYFEAKTVAELPMNLIPPGFFFIVIYFGTQLSLYSADKFFIFCICYTGLILYLLNFYGNSFALFFGAIFSNLEVAIESGPVSSTQILTITFFIFAGYFSSTSSIPIAFRWISYLSVASKQPFRYAFQGLYLNEITDLNLDCENLAGAQRCDPIAMLGAEINMWTCVGALFGMVGFYRILALLALKLRVRKLGS